MAHILKSWSFRNKPFGKMSFGKIPFPLCRLVMCPTEICLSEKWCSTTLALASKYSNCQRTMPLDSKEEEKTRIFVYQEENEKVLLKKDVSSENESISIF